MMTLKCCPHCGSFDYTHRGIDDGGGDYGSAVCDQYECETCGYGWEEGCIEYGDDDDDDGQMIDFPNTGRSESASEREEGFSGGYDLTDDMPW